MVDWPMKTYAKVQRAQLRFCLNITLYIFFKYYLEALPVIVEEEKLQKRNKRKK